MVSPTIHETALLLGGTEAWVRSLVAREIIGDRWSTILSAKYHIEPKRFKYEIVPGKLAKYMEISEAELEQRLKEVRKNAVL